MDEAEPVESCMCGIDLEARLALSVTGSGMLGFVGVL